MKAPTRHEPPDARPSAVTRLVITSLAAILVTSGCGRPAGRQVDTQQPPGTYRFTEDWFSPHEPQWQRLLADMKDKPNLAYLEVGVFEGKSFFWMLDNVLTHPTSRATAVDIFPLDLKQRFMDNLAVSGAEGKVTVLSGYSQVELRPLDRGSFDVIYLDGSHAAKDVLTDAVLAWALLRNGGLLIFDDYALRPDWPPEFRPQVAIDLFLTAFRNDLEIVDRDSQLFIRKRELPGPYFLRLGNCAYMWPARTLYRIGEPEPTQLGEAERLAIEKLARSRPVGMVDFPSNAELTADPDGLALAQRCGFALAPPITPDTAR